MSYMSHTIWIMFLILIIQCWQWPSVSHWNKEQKRFEKSLMISSFVFPNCWGLITINLFSWWFHDNFVNSYPWNIGHVSKRVKGSVSKKVFQKTFKQCAKQLEIFTIICMKSSKNTKKIIILRMVRLTKNDFLTRWLNFDLFEIKKIIFRAHMYVGYNATRLCRRKVHVFWYFSYNSINVDCSNRYNLNLYCSCLVKSCSMAGVAGKGL